MFIQKLRSTSAAFMDRAFDLESRLINRRGRFVACYHRVLPAAQARDEWVHDSMWITPATFESQIRWFQKIGEIVPYQRLLDFTRPNAQPLFSITFDDGWIDNFTIAEPILQRLDVPFTIFLTTSVMEKGHLIWPEDVTLKTRQALSSTSDAEIRRCIQPLFSRPPGTRENLPIRIMLQEAIEELKLITETERTERIGHFFESLRLSEEPLRGHMMTWADAEEMRRRGVYFGSHSHTHRICSEASQEELCCELETSMDQFQRNLAVKIDAFAYPNARYKGSEASALRETGYLYAFRLHNLPVESDQNPYFIPRYICCERTARSPGLMSLRFLNVPFF